jgi:hypothetical protein
MAASIPSHTSHHFLHIHLSSLRPLSLSLCLPRGFLPSTISPPFILIDSSIVAIIRSGPLPSLQFVSLLLRSFFCSHSTNVCLFFPSSLLVLCSHVCFLVCFFFFPPFLPGDVCLSISLLFCCVCNHPSLSHIPLSLLHTSVSLIIHIIHIFCTFLGFDCNTNFGLSLPSSTLISSPHTTDTLYECS